METQDHQTSERNYIAFISYRHKPLDLSIAKKLHRRIERYVIPKELRRDSGKKLGLVFRDQDELPIANNLTENICTALDHAEFLIVVCSPDTPESLWVQREITYFLEHHDRNHVLAILIDGDPEKSFPKQLTEVRDVDGNLIEQIEPLAANIVADSAAKRNRLFRTESLRILASLIGCPYDALYHREQRYRMRRFAIAAAAALLIASGFIGMLLNRNARIKEQLRASMINESRALAALSKNAYREGNYRQALEYALDALPGRNPDRPYVAEAEEALSEELSLYREDTAMTYVQSLEQDTEISALALQADGCRVALGDGFGYIRVFDMNSGALLWSAKPSDYVRRLCFVGDTLFADLGLQNTVYSKDGEQIRWSEDDSVVCVNEKKGMYLSYTRFTDGLPPQVKDVSSGRVLYEPGPLDNDYYELVKGAISRDGRFCAVLAKYAGDEEGADLYVFDLEAGTRKLAESGLMYASVLADYDLLFDESGNLILSLCGRGNLLADREEWNGDCVTLYERSSGWEKKFTVYPDFGTVERQGIDLSAYLDYMGCVNGGILLASRNRLVRVDTAAGQIRWQKDLPGRVAAAKVYPGGDLVGLILTDGTITMCTTDKGQLSIDSELAFYRCQYDICGGAISGDTLNGGKYAVISTRNRNRLSVVSAWKNENLSGLPWSAKTPKNARFISSPSESAVAAVYRDGASDTCHVYYQDLTDENMTREFPITFDEYMDFSSHRDRALLTNTGKLILSGKVYDFMAGAAGSVDSVGAAGSVDSAGTAGSAGDAAGSAGGAVTGLSVSGKLPGKYDGNKSASCIDGQSKKVISTAIEQDPSTYAYSLSVWEDGVFTGKTSEVPLEAMFSAASSETSGGGEEADGSGENAAGGGENAAGGGEKAAGGGEKAAGGGEEAIGGGENTDGGGLCFDKEQARCICRAVGANGYAVVCGKKEFRGDGAYAQYNMERDEWAVMGYMGADEEQVLALAGSKPWIATQKEDGTLCLFDLSTGKEILSMENTLLGESVAKIIFAQNDELLVVFAKTGALAIYSTKDGSELHHSIYSGSNLRFHAGARYEVHSIPQGVPGRGQSGSGRSESGQSGSGQSGSGRRGSGRSGLDGQSGRILIICDDMTYTESSAIILDAASMKKTGFHEGISCYFPSTNTVIVSHDNREPCMSELFGVEFMQEKAERMLQGLID